MELLAVSPASKYGGEADVMVRLFQAGLARYHMRKPWWSEADCVALLEAVAAKWHARISIHQHHQLAQTYDLGLHFKEGVAVHQSTLNSSRSLHGFEQLEASLSPVDYAFLSPVFQSISKCDYAPSWTEAQLRTALSGTLPAKLYALGGIAVGKVQHALDLGFDGVVLHGALWQSPDPLATFANIVKEAA
jgi:thiamine-phosphate pyrophosphorylase